MTNQPLTLSTNSGSDVLGVTVPRLWTPPLRELTPETSYGFDVIDFARDVLNEPLDPWQEWTVIHTGELLPDGRPRFRVVLVLVSRQQGKTHLLKVLTLFWLFVEQQRLVLGTSTNRDYAKEAWLAAADLATDVEFLRDEVADVRKANGSETITTTAGCRYKIAASNRRGGRSLTINRLILDELREHASWDAWNASVNATNAVPSAQVYAISNQGDDSSVVLDALRTPALDHIERGGGDERLGLFEYSAPDGSSPDDPEALAQ
ncbi:terminase, partial [Pseudonocardia sp. KRD-169]|nr:terminase [Pseudonocardia abyssalis]